MSFSPRPVAAFTIPTLPLNCVRQARAIALVQIAEPHRQKRNFVPQSPPWRGLRSLRSARAESAASIILVFSDRNAAAECRFSRGIPSDSSRNGNRIKIARLYSAARSHGHTTFRSPCRHFTLIGNSPPRCPSTSVSSLMGVVRVRVPVRRNLTAPVFMPST